MRISNIFGQFNGQSASAIPENQVVEYVKNAQNGNKKAFNAIIVANKARIVRIIKSLKMLEKCLRDPDFADDLFIEGQIGLCNAVTNFTLSKGCKFYPYANQYIRGAILDFLNTSVSTIRIPKSVSQQLYSIKKISAGTVVTSLNAGIIASKTNLSSAQVLKISKYNYSIISLFKKNAATSDEFVVTDKKGICSVSVDSEFLKNDFSSNLWAAFNALSQREQFVISKHLALFNDEELSFSKIGDLIEISKPRAQQIFKAACKKLSKALNAPCFDGYFAA